MTIDDILAILSGYRSNDYDPAPIFTVAGRTAIAWRFICLQEAVCEACDGFGCHLGAERDSDGEPYISEIECDQCKGEGEIATGMVQLHMVGDNHVHTFDPTELSLYEGDVCSCGQIGCEWH